MYAKTRNSLAHAFLGPACDPSRANPVASAIAHSTRYKFAALFLSVAALCLGCDDSTGPTVRPTVSRRGPPMEPGSRSPAAVWGG